MQQDTQIKCDNHSNSAKPRVAGVPKREQKPHSGPQEGPHRAVPCRAERQINGFFHHNRGGDSAGEWLSKSQSAGEEDAQSDSHSRLDDAQPRSQAFPLQPGGRLHCGFSVSARSSRSSGAFANASAPCSISSSLSRKPHKTPIVLIPAARPVSMSTPLSPM